MIENNEASVVEDIDRSYVGRTDIQNMINESLKAQSITIDLLTEQNKQLKLDIDRLKRKQEADAKAIQQLFGFFHASGSLDDMNERIEKLEKYQ
jgi:hypothetical protein